MSPSIATHAAALAWFAAEHVNLLTAQQLAARLEPRGVAAGVGVDDLAARQVGIAAIDSLGDSADRTAGRKFLGQAHARLGDHAEARAVGRQAVDLYRGQNRTAEADRLVERLST